jgi:hypothetical protein
MGVKLVASSGGSVELVPTNTASNFTVTVPAKTGTMAMDGPAFSAYSNVNQSITNAAITKIQLNIETFDTNNNFDSTTNYRFTPTVAGYYQISGAITFTSTTNNQGIGAIIYKNGSAYAWGTAVATTSMYPTASVSSLIYLNGSTDYIEMYVYNGAGATVSTNGNSTYTYLTGALVRGA